MPTRYGIPANRLVSVFKWLLLFAILALTQVMVTCDSCYADTAKAWRNFLYSFSLFSLLWLGNGYLSNNLDRWAIPWKSGPGKRFIITLLAVFVYSALTIFLINWVWYVLIPRRDISFLATSTIGWNMISQMVITYFITMTLHAIAFLRNWQREAVQSERLQKEHALSQYEALKNQVNPHFLFNSLNALTSLVHEKPDLAVKFIKQLGEVYRYVLDSQHKEVVSLEEELNFAQRFVFLQKIRYGEAFEVHLPKHPPPGLHLPPLALQMLLENALKHNRVLVKEPLQVQVRVENHTLVVENTLQPKTQHEPPSGLGLPNIKARYLQLTDKKVQIQASPTHFTVSLPLVSFQE